MIARKRKLKKNGSGKKMASNEKSAVGKAKDGWEKKASILGKLFKKLTFF